MPQFGGRSLSILKVTDPDLVRVMLATIAETDFTIYQGPRTQAEQEADFAKGVSRAHWLQSPHDFNPCFALDCAPWPIQWGNIKAFRDLAEVVKHHSKRLGIEVTWGGDWVSIRDMPHFELADWRIRARKQMKGKADVVPLTS